MGSAPCNGTRSSAKRHPGITRKMNRSAFEKDRSDIEAVRYIRITGRIWPVDAAAAGDTKGLLRLPAIGRDRNASVARVRIDLPANRTGRLPYRRKSGDTAVFRYRYRYG